MQVAPAELADHSPFLTLCLAIRALLHRLHDAGRLGKIHCLGDLPLGIKGLNEWRRGDPRSMSRRRHRLTPSSGVRQGRRVVILPVGVYLPLLLCDNTQLVTVRPRHFLIGQHKNIEETAVVSILMTPNFGFRYFTNSLQAPRGWQAVKIHRWSAILEKNPGLFLNNYIPACAMGSR